MKLYHDSQDNIYRKPFGAAVSGSSVHLALKVVPEEGESPEQVQVRLWQDETGERFVDMQPAGEDMYEVDITMPAEPGLLWYYFIVKVSGSTLYYGNPTKLGGAGSMQDYEPESYQITVYDYAPVPEWFKDSVVYQIFPDRFAIDDEWEERCTEALEKQSGRNGQGKFIEEDWERPAYYVRDDEGNVTDWPFYGGSLRGITEKLDHLTSLGVKAIYMNPIFEAASNHRYDTGDYMKIDPLLGTEEDLRELADEAGKRGIKIILDGVFSHTGADSRYFDKYGNYGGTGAFTDPDSQYRDWYEFREDDPVGYRSWWGVRDLPEVNELEPGFTDLICGENGVLAKWLDAGASGWRLDVADELPDEFIAKIRARIKAKNEDNVLIGEVWEDASNKISYDERRRYLMGHELDSTMNYPLRDTLMRFMDHEEDAGEVAAHIMSLAENYPPENFYGALNLIGSHDRRRILTAMGADKDFGWAAARVKLLSIMQYALPGVPSIYYGDEAGMTGGTDPENRSCYPWGKEDPGLMFHYRQLGVLYERHPVLRSGDLRFVDTGDSDILGFIRSDEDEKIAVFVNRSGDERRISKNVLEGQNAVYALDLLTSKKVDLSDDISIYGNTALMVLLLDEAPASFDMGRTAGVICHISSIPGRKLGRRAREFADFLKSAGMGLWQILPLDPPGVGGSPYSSDAAFAGDAGLIDYEELPDLEGFDAFCKENAYWLDDYAAYVSSKETGGSADEDVIRRVKEEQYYFDVQWQDLRSYANSIGIKIIGDLPVYVTADSADVMANRELFQIDEEGRLRRHAGVPPDYFSPEGQDWGNPLYDWKRMSSDDYLWWRQRLEQCFRRYDFVRLDHFRSFSEYYAIPYGESPVTGIWQHGPGLDFFRKIGEGTDGCLPILAEDLGMLDPCVHDLLKLTGFPGMNIWQFSADEMKAMNREEASHRVFYTGTHDNQTLMGWCRQRGLDYGDALDIIKTLYESDAPWVIIQMQDMFMLGDEARMNVPGIAEGNWGWHLEGESVIDSVSDATKIAAGFRVLAEETGRTGRKEKL